MARLKKPWGGAFEGATHPLAERFTVSVHFDRRFYKYDIMGSIAHARMLARCGLITRREAQMIEKGLKEIRREIEEGRFRFDPGLEDIHMNIERTLTDKIGEAGAKLHTGRSRNDQIALDLRLYLKDEITGLRSAIKGLAGALTGLSKRYRELVMPGYTHLRPAQPILFSQYLGAYRGMLLRDAERLAACFRRTDEMPLGSGALAGSSLPLDRGYVARVLKFRRVTANSVDAVSDRDFVIEFTSACALIMMHLSRLCEDTIIFSSEEFGFVILPEPFMTGSSLMPQKRNPDVLELVRGKTGRVYGSLMALLTAMKGLPLAYNRDMQEDKEPLFDAADTTAACLEVMTQLVKGIRLDRERISRSLSIGFLAATDVAEYLVTKGVPFRQAHEIVGRMVRYCMAQKKGLNQLTLRELKQFSPRFQADVLKRLSPSSSRPPVPQRPAPPVRKPGRSP